LLRCWADGPLAKRDGPAWRFSLEEIGEKEHRQRRFGDLERLVAFLRCELSVRDREEGSEP
jgi:hypothetical protein